MITHTQCLGILFYFTVVRMHYGVCTTERLLHWSFPLHHCRFMPVKMGLLAIASRSISMKMYGHVTSYIGLTLEKRIMFMKVKVSSNQEIFAKNVITAVRG